MQVLLTTRAQEILDSITHIAQLDAGKWVFQGAKADFDPHKEVPATPLDPALLARLKEEAPTNAGFTTAVKMINTTIRYGEATILKNINWEVKKGERWNVSGPNGAGKSTLLSLITADNPQAYANEIWLFGRRRRPAESIWDIKKRIGFVSPELHLYFDTAATAFDVVASGLFDTIGLFRPLHEAQEALA